MTDLDPLVIDLFSPQASRPRAVKVRQHSSRSYRRYRRLDEKLDGPGRLP
jgi:hypothetical protein